MLPSIAKLATRYNITPLKKYSQNFIFDETLCDKIVKQALIDHKSHILEIGPGTAGLTRSILKAFPTKLTVVETDSRCLPLLEEIKNIYPSLEILYNDGLKINLMKISKNTKLNIIANLPYNIGTKLLINWIYQIECVKNMVLMLQKEVVDRIVAPIGTKVYGRLSIICQLVCKVEKCFNVNPKAFYPKPKIWSSIVRLIPRKNIPSDELLKKTGQVTLKAFSGRRKMIKSSLKQLFPNIEMILALLGINQSLRAENLTPEDYLQIAKFL